MKRIQDLLQEESGASAAEYGILVALIAAACIYAIQLLGINIAAVFTTAATAISGS